MKHLKDIEYEEFQEYMYYKTHGYIWTPSTLKFVCNSGDNNPEKIGELMLLKRVCDCYDEEIDDAKKKYGSGWVEFDEDEIHRFMIPTGCHWNDIRNCPENVGSAILNSMQGIEAANQDTLSGLFTGFDEAEWTNKNNLPDKKLKDLVEHFSERNLGNSNYDADIMGDANEYLIRHFADDDNKNAGDFFTPRTIVKLLIKMLAPEANHSIYDPACGTGGMLIEYVRQTSGVFYSTGVSACILFMNNNKPAERDGKVILIDAGTIVHARRAQKYMDDSDVERVYKLFSDYEDVLESSWIK